MKKISIIRTCVFFILGIFLASSASATLITNGDFSRGLRGWKSDGDVTKAKGRGVPKMDGKFARIGFTDDEYPKSRLWQNFDVSGINKIQISFDWFFAYLDDTKKPKDVFASILQERDSKPFQKIEVYTVLTNDTDPSVDEQIQSGFFSGIFDVSGFDGKARLRFQLSENAGVLSRVGIDNVNVSPVPEPTTVLLFGAGLAGLLAAQRRKKK